MESNTQSTSNAEQKYINEFNELQKKAYSIAVEHLETSFNLVKSNGFIQWKNKTSRW